VEDQVYRSNKCDASSFPFLATLQLNTVVYLSYDDLSRDLAAFFAEKEINVVRRAGRTSAMHIAGADLLLLARST
jgi:hypothetical protein